MVRANVGRMDVINAMQALVQARRLHVDGGGSQAGDKFAAWVNGAGFPGEAIRLNSTESDDAGSAARSSGTSNRHLRFQYIRASSPSRTAR